MNMRETRYLWVGNLGENVREDRITEYFRRYGKIDKVRFLSKRSGEGGLTAYVAFMDIRSAQKAKTAINIIGDRELLTDYFDPVARAGNEEDQRHVPPQQSQSRSYRRYELIKDSGLEERIGREMQATSERSYQASETGSNNSGEKLRTKREVGEARARSQSSVKRQDVKGPKKKIDEANIKVKKGSLKNLKERGRSPTVKQRKSYTSSGSSPSRSGSKRQESSTEGRSSSGASGSRSVSDGRRSSSVTSSSSTGSSNSSKSQHSNSESSESSYEIEEKPESRKLVAMCIRKLPVRPTITSLRDGIFHEFKKYGKVKSVLVRGDGADRHALVLFRTAAEASKAIAHARTKLLFGAAIVASIYEGEVSGQELEECGGIIDEFHPRASRTLFVGNLDKTVGYSDIQNIFVRFGEIVAIEIKKQHNVPQYAFLQYTDIMSVVRAITKMDGEKLGRNTLKLGFGKTVISSCLWVDGVTDSFTENYLSRCFQRYGPVKHVVIDRSRGQALVFYAQYDFAQSAMQKLRARKLNGSRLKMDYASNELVEIFLKHMKNSGQSFQGLENIRQLLQPPSSPVATSIPASGSSGYTRSSIPQEPRSAYYEDRHQSNFSDEQYTEGNYRRGWRGRSRERHTFPVEQPAFSRPKRNYEDSFSRPDYHRESTWEHEGYSEGRGRLAQHDQDYRQRDYDFRRDHSRYARKQSSRNSVPYDETLRYRGSRDRYREERDSESVRDREPICDRYFSRSVHLSPSHPRYHPRRSRSISPPPPRDSERYGSERASGEPSFRRRGSCSPNVRYDSIHRMNSMESKSSSHSESRYPVRSGDVDMREYMGDDKLSVSSLQSDERIVEFTERAKKLRVRKRVSADLPAQESSLSPQPHYKYRGDGIHIKQSPNNCNETSWHSDSPPYSENSRSVSGTPTRDENEDLIGEVIIKKSGSRVTEKSSTIDQVKPHQKSGIGDDKLGDKDYRKDFAGSSSSIKSDASNKSRPKSRSTSLIQRVHSPPAIKKESVTYEKDFDYRKHSTMRSSKSGFHNSTQQKRSKNSRSSEQTRTTDAGSDYESSERRMPSGGTSLLKREYSPKLKDRDEYLPKRAKTNVRSGSKEKYKDTRRKTDTASERNEKPSQSQKRRHSPDTDLSAVKIKREKKSTSEHHKHKSSHEHPSQKHEAPMSIASQMFLQDEEDSGTESPAVVSKTETIKIEEQPIEIEKSLPVEKPGSPIQIDIAAASLSAAKSLLPKALSKMAKQNEPTKEDDHEQRKKDGNLTELEKEKERLQKLLSKLDSEKRLDPKDAEEVADVVLQELTEKARSKLNVVKADKPSIQAQEEKESIKQKTDVVKVIADETFLEIDGGDELDQLESDDVTFEEEVVVDTIEEVTEDEIIEMEEVTVKEEEVDEVDEPTVTEEYNVNVEEVQEIIETPDLPAPVSDLSIPVIPSADLSKIDNTQSYRKQMEAKRKELEKMEKKRDSQRRKMFKKQEKEKMKQIERVTAMRGPSQSVISSVDEEVDCESSSKDIVDDTLKVEIDHNIDYQTTEVPVDDAESPVVYDENKNHMKNDDVPSAVGCGETSNKSHIEDNKISVNVIPTVSDDRKPVLTESKNEELWPPDRGKNTEQKCDTNDKPDSFAMNLSQLSSKNVIKDTTPNTPNSAGPNTPVSLVKDGSPKAATQAVTPTGSLVNSQAQRTQAIAQSAAQTNRTPVFTTPSPASSTSSSKSQRQMKQKQMKIPHQRHGHSSRLGQSRSDQSSRAHAHHSGTDHRRQSSHSHRSRSHVNSSSSSQNHHKSEGYKKQTPQMSSRSLATITVGLDASPSKPLTKNELERLRHELESVRSQLNAESVSPSSLSPCSDDENVCKSQSPAQLLSPMSPLLKSPGNIMMYNRKSDGNSSTALNNSTSTTSSLTDRLKLLGKVKKRSSCSISDVKTEVPAQEHMPNERVESVDNRVYRSCIIDQDSERLSHISHNDNEFTHPQPAVTPLPQNVPLFSGSKFLQPLVCPIPDADFPTVPSAEPALRSVASDMNIGNERAGDGNGMCDQSLISSNSGPKNVLSLSRYNLPGTAERQSDAFGKKYRGEDIDSGRLTTPQVQSSNYDRVSDQPKRLNVDDTSDPVSSNTSITGHGSPMAILPPTANAQPTELSVESDAQSTNTNLQEFATVASEVKSIKNDGKETLVDEQHLYIEDAVTAVDMVCEVDIESGSCMEISAEDTTNTNTGEDTLLVEGCVSIVANMKETKLNTIVTSDNPLSEITETDNKNDESDNVKAVELHSSDLDVSKKPAEQSESDLTVKKKMKMDSPLPSNEGNDQNKKEKIKGDKKKASSKSESSKTKVSSKHKIVKDGKKDKVLKKDSYKKTKSEGLKVKSSDAKPILGAEAVVMKASPKVSVSNANEKPSTTCSEQDTELPNPNFSESRRNLLDRNMTESAMSDGEEKDEENTSTGKSEKISIHSDARSEKKTKSKTEKREKTELASSSYDKEKGEFGQKSADNRETKVELASKPSGKTDNKSDVALQQSKKKKKKKHGIDKRDKHAEKKQVKSAQEGRSGTDSLKKKSDGGEKLKKSIMEKTKSSESSADGIRKSEKSQLSAEHSRSSTQSSMEKATSGLAKKDSKLHKKSKSNLDLKVSHSAPLSSSKKSGDILDGKKKSKKSHHSKKLEKTVSVATKKSPQPLVFSDSSDDTDNEEFIKEPSIVHDDQMKVESEKSFVSDVNNDKKWSDYDDEGERRKRQWSMSSSSSCLDLSSHGATSAMLTTETIKNETILPDDFKDVEFAGSSPEGDFDERSKNRSFISDHRSVASVSSQKQKRKPFVSHSKKTMVEAKSDHKPWFGSSSDSSDDRLVMSLTNSESSDDVSKPKKSTVKRAAMAFSDDDSEPELEQEKKNIKPQLKALPAKTEAKLKMAGNDKSKVQQTLIEKSVLDRTTESKKKEKSMKKFDSKVARKSAKMHRKEKKKDFSEHEQRKEKRKPELCEIESLRKEKKKAEPTENESQRKEKKKELSENESQRKEKRKPELLENESHRKDKSKPALSDSEAQRKEKRKLDLSSENDSDNAEDSRSSSKTKLKHSTKFRKLDMMREQSPKKMSGKPEQKFARSSPKPTDQKEKFHSKRKKHKDTSKTRFIKTEDSSKMRTGKVDESSKMRTNKTDDSSKTRTSKIGDSSKTRTGKMEDSSKMRTGNAEDSSKIVTGKIEDPSKIRTGQIEVEKASLEQISDKSDAKVEKSDLTSTVRKKEKISSKSGSGKLEELSKNSGKSQTPDQELSKHQKKSVKVQKKSDALSYKFDTTRNETDLVDKGSLSKDSRTKTDDKSDEKSRKQNPQSLNKDRKSPPPLEEEIPKNPDFPKMHTESIGISLFGSDSDDDDNNFLIDEERDQSPSIDDHPIKIVAEETTEPKLPDKATAKTLKQNRKDSGDNFSSETTSDESDKEEMMAVKCAISMLDGDNKILDAKSEKGLPESPKQEGACAESSSGFLKTPLEKLPPRPRSLSPLKKVVESRNRKRSHDLCDVKREKLSINSTPYPISQRRVHYDRKDRRENMDNIKSISHERDEEAVRSIMGILDESSDADSYFSDVKIEEGSCHQNVTDTVRQEVERPHRKSKDSDGGGDVAQPSVDSQSEDLEKEVESSHENEDTDGDFTKTRSTAEENELAAAVSAIEGLFGDFEDGNDGDNYISDSPHPPASHHVSKEKVSQKESVKHSHPNLSSKQEQMYVIDEKSKEARVVESTTMGQPEVDKYQEQELSTELKTGTSAQTVSSTLPGSYLELPSVRTEQDHYKKSFAHEQALSYESRPKESNETKHTPPVKVAESAWVTAAQKPVIMESDFKHLKTTENLPSRMDENKFEEPVISSTQQPTRKSSPQPATKHDTFDQNAAQPLSTVSTAGDAMLPSNSMPFVASVQAPGIQKKPSTTSATASHPFVAVSTAVGMQSSVLLPSKAVAEEATGDSQKSIDQRPDQAPVVEARPAPEQRRSSYAMAGSSSSLGGFASQSTSKPELSKQASDPSPHVPPPHPQMHHPHSSVPTQPTVSVKNTPLTTVTLPSDPGSRMVFSHAHNAPFVGYQEQQMLPMHNQVLPQPPFGLAQSRFTNSPVPSAAMMAFPHPLTSQPQQETMQRGITNPYLLQHSASASHIPPIQNDVTTQARIRESQQATHNQPTVEKTDVQRTVSSNQVINSTLVSTSVPGMPQMPQQYLHPAQANIQQKTVYPPHLYYPGTAVPHFQALPPYMTPFLGIRPTIPSVPPIPIMRTAPEDTSRSTQKPSQAPQPRAMASHPYPTSREQPSHIPVTRPSYPMNPQVPMHPAYNVPHAPPDTRHPTPPAAHQPQYVNQQPSQYQPQRTEHGDRFIRAENERSQMDMVDQHFALSGVATNLPVTQSHQAQTVTKETKGYPQAPETQQTPTTLQHPPSSSHSNMFSQIMPRHVLGMPHGLLPHGEKYSAAIPGVLPWPYSGGSFRPPPIPQQSQLQLPRLHTPQHHDTYQGQAITNPNPSPKPKADAPDQVMDLFQRYPVIWQGLLALKNDSAAVQTHFICGDRSLAQACLPQPDSHVETDKERNLAVLRIVQRMRLEPQQLEGIDNRIRENSDYCVLLALPCGRDKTDVHHQQCALKRSFIDYLKQKQAAGIVNVQHQQMQSHLQYVLHVFPPCDFTTKHLQCHARDLLSNINDIQHIMIVIAAV